MKRLSLVAALFASACCTSLPRLPSKTLTLPPAPRRFADVTMSRGQLYDAKRGNRQVAITMYAPQAAQGKLPIVVFSHGIGEDRDSYEYLGRALAHAGYIAVHATHAGTDKATLKKGYRYLYRATKEKSNWVNRPLDVSFVLDKLSGRADIDFDRVAVAGHSAGAFTAFAVAGLKMTDGSLRDPRVKVIVPMSMPRMPGVVAPGGYDAIGVPVLNLTGTCDTSLIYRTFPRHRRVPFEESHDPRHYLVTLKGVNHDMFSAARDSHHPLIASVTIAFLDAWLRDDANARAFFDEAGRGYELSVERKSGGAR